MNLTLKAVKEEDYRCVYAFQCEYLDQEEFEDFIRRVEANPDLYNEAMIDGELAGICYGQPSDRDASCISLQGIAVSLDEKKGYARRGIGSRLIKEFEEAVKERGYFKIGVGSADDYKVEMFYLKNGFQPCELVAKGPNYEEYERVKVADYESGKIIKQELFHKYNPREVIFIFQKSLS